MRLAHFALTLVIATSVACSDERAPPKAPPGGPPPVAPTTDTPPLRAPPIAPRTTAKPPPVPREASVTWTVPEGWLEEAGSSRMRAAQFVIGDAAAGSPVHCIVYIGIGGGTQANVDRWIGQFRQADGSSSRDAADVAESEHDGLRITRASVRGTFAAQAMPGQGDALNADAWRLLAAVVENGGDSVFIKLVGPVELLDANEEKFDALLGSLRPR